ncbi:hypothetical protein I4U23_004041 [Adineta vaga]|nr:hypothetical protein I4U23_004041 [Adineta vaga]
MNPIDIKLKQLEFFDLDDANLQADLKVFVEKTPVTSTTTIVNEDEWKYTSTDEPSIADSIEQYLWTT